MAKGDKVKSAQGADAETRKVVVRKFTGALLLRAGAEEVYTSRGRTRSRTLAQLKDGDATIRVTCNMSKAEINPATSYEFVYNDDPTYGASYSYWPERVTGGLIDATEANDVSTKVITIRKVDDVALAAHKAAMTKALNDL